MTFRSHEGVTLIELVAAVTILGLLAASVGLVRGTSGPTSDPDEEARLRALRDGRPVTVADTLGVRIFLPDGRAIAPGRDPLTGARVDSLAASVDPSPSIR